MVVTVARIKALKEQLGANLFAVDPAERSAFELRNLLREIGLRRQTGVCRPIGRNEPTMRIGEVIGTVTLSQWHPSLTGAAWRICVPLNRDGFEGFRGRPRGTVCDL